MKQYGVLEENMTWTMHTTSGWLGCLTHFVMNHFPDCLDLTKSIALQTFLDWAYASLPAQINLKY